MRRGSQTWTWLQAGKAPLGRFSRKSSEFVASSTDAGGPAERKAASSQQRSAEVDGAAGQRCSDPVDRRVADAVLAEGGDVDVATGAPRANGSGPDHHRPVDASVPSGLDAAAQQRAPAEVRVGVAAEGAASGSHSGMERSASAPAVEVNASATQPHHAPVAQSRNSPHGRSGVEPGLLLTAANLARLNAQPRTAEGQGVRHVQGQLDDRGRCRIDNM